MGAFIVYIPTITGVKIIGRESIISTYNFTTMVNWFSKSDCLENLEQKIANPLSAASLDDVVSRSGQRIFNFGQL